MGVALIVILVILLLWPTIMKWVGRYMARRTEDYLRRATGMPPRPGSRAAKKQARQKTRESESGESHQQYNTFQGYRRRAHRGPYDFDPNEPIIPHEYAEDVDFVETKDFSETAIAADGEGTRHVRFHESQVSDVEWEEIKPKNGNNK